MSLASNVRCILKLQPNQYLKIISYVKTCRGIALRKGMKNERHYVSERKPDSSSLTKVKSKGQVATTVREVKETTKTVSYLGVIFFGVGVTSFILYTIFRELFSSNSPNSIYTAALEKCRKDTRVVDLLGDPIKGFGEETRRGRRRHVSHIIYEREGVQYLRMKFYLQGTRRQGTVHLEMKKTPCLIGMREELSHGCEPLRALFSHCEYRLIMNEFLGVEGKDGTAGLVTHCHRNALERKKGKTIKLLHNVTEFFHRKNTSYLQNGSRNILL